MNILFLFLISSYSIACGNPISLEKIFSENKGLPTRSHFETYLKTLFNKAPLREKYCGEKFDSPACFQKLRKLDLPTLIKIQNGIRHEDLLIHERSGQVDIDEFLVKEFSNSEARAGFESDDLHRIPLIIKQTDYSENFLNMVAVQCQQHLQQKNNEIHLGKLLVNPPGDLLEFLRKKPLPVFEYSQAFESVALALETSGRAADFFSVCLENVEKSCELTPESELCELKRTVNATAWKYSEFTHQINYFEAIRDDGHRLYPSTKEKLMNKLVLRTPASVMDLSRRFREGICLSN